MVLTYWRPRRKAIEAATLTWVAFAFALLILGLGLVEGLATGRFPVDPHKTETMP